MIRKRYMYLSEEIFKENPNISIHNAPSLNARQDILVTEVPELGKQAALKAIEEWGQPISKITHLIFCTSSGIEMPGADYQLTRLIGLQPSVQRFMIYLQACFAGGTALRLAKDIAEHNAGARVLIVCSEITAVCFHAPSDSNLDILVSSAIFSDGAAAVIVGAKPDTGIEFPSYQLVSATQTLIPDTGNELMGRIREVGMTCRFSRDVPNIIGNNIAQCCTETLGRFGISDWNTLFYVVHPGGPAILRMIEEKLGLTNEKLSASRHVLSEYGNMSGPTVFFILDEMRKKSKEEGRATTGEGLEWGVLFGFGPGLTVETVVLRGIAI